MRLLTHVDESGDRFRFDCSGRSRKDLQAMSAVLNNLERKHWTARHETPFDEGVRS